MTRQILILRTIGALFLLSGLFTLTFFTRAGGASPLAIGGAALYLVAMVAIGAGLLCRHPWARTGAIVAILYKTCQVIFFTIHDAQMMGRHSLDTLSRLAPYLPMVPIVALLLTAAYWLTRPATAELFRRDT
jgi:hypothetical protein